MSKAKIVYENIAVGAVGKFNVVSDNKTDFSNIEKIKEPLYNSIEYTNPCDYYSTLLDGSNDPIDNEYPGYWSESISNDLGAFENPVCIEFLSNDIFSTNGINLIFDKKNDLFATSIDIFYYLRNEIVFEKHINPILAEVYIDTNVELYDKILLKFNSINKPHSPLKIKSVVQGTHVIFEGKGLLNVSINQSMNEISSELPISTCNFDLKTNKKYFFQKGQKFKVYYEDKLRGVFYIRSNKEIDVDKYSIQAEDAIGLLDGIPFTGGIYINEDVVNVINQISKLSNINIEIDKKIYGKKISGYIPFENCRKALNLILMSLGAIVKTSNIDNIKICYLNNEVCANIDKKNVFVGGTKTSTDIPHSINISYHKYYGDYTNQLSLYKNDDDCVYNNLFIKFQEPIFDYEIKNGKVIEFKNNYAIINALKNCELIGYGYNHSIKSVQVINDIIPHYLSQSNVKITNNTLINQDNVDDVVKLCYNYFAKTQKINCKVATRKTKTNKSVYGSFFYGQKKYTNVSSSIDNDFDLGDVVIIPTKNEAFKGRVINQKYHLNGNLIVKEIEVLLE